MHLPIFLYFVCQPLLKTCIKTESYIFLFSINKVLLNGIINGMQKMKTYAIYQSMRYLLILINVIICVSIRLKGELLPLVFTMTELAISMLLIIQITGEVNWLRSKNWKKWFQIHYKYGVKTIIGGFLIEVNTNPALFTDTALQKDMLPKLVDDAVKLAL